MGAVTQVRRTPIPAVEDPETGGLWDDGAERLHVLRHCRWCGDEITGTAVLQGHWDEFVRDAVIAAVVRTVEQEVCCG